MKPKPPAICPHCGQDTRTQPTLLPEARSSVVADWAKAPWGTPEALAHLYNEAAPDNVVAVETLSPKRREKARRLLKEFPDRAWWERVFANYRKSRFLSGRIAPTNGHSTPFRPDFDWLLATNKSGIENAVRVHDGAHDD